MDAQFAGGQLGQDFFLFHREPPESWFRRIGGCPGRIITATASLDNRAARGERGPAAAIDRPLVAIDLPGHGTTIHGRTHKIEGLAFAGTRGIKQVEISTDGGEHWMPAIVDAPLSPYSWQFWHYEWTVPKAGRHTLLVRATDGNGRLQTSVEQDPAPDGATGLHEVTVTIVL